MEAFHAGCLGFAIALHLYGYNLLVLLENEINLIIAFAPIINIETMDEGFADDISSYG